MLNDIKFNRDAIENGVWVQLKNSRFLIASVENSKFKAAVLNHGVENYTDEVFCELLSLHILLDWSDVKQPDGSDLSYSHEMAKLALLTNDEVRALVDHVSTSLKYYSEQIS